MIKFSLFFVFFLLVPENSVQTKCFHYLHKHLTWGLLDRKKLNVHETSHSFDHINSIQFGGISTFYSDEKN